MNISQRLAVGMVALWLATALMAPAIAAGAAQTQPAADPAVEALVAQLADESWLVRQRAQDALAQMGADVRPRIVRLVEETEDEEVRTRARACLRQIDDNRTTGPSFITLHGARVPPERAFADLARQANTSIRTNPPDLWQTRSWPAVDLDIERQPFWAAMKRLCAAYGVVPQSAGREMVLVHQSTAGARSPFAGPSITTGGFLVVAQTISTTSYVELNQPRTIRRHCNLQLQILPEPKFYVMQGTLSPRVEEAVDEKGNSLLMAGVSGNDYMQFMNNWAWNLSIALSPKPDSGTRIASLRGSARFLIQSRAATVEIEEALAARNVSRTIAGRKFLLKQIIPRGDFYEAQIVLYRSGWGQNEWSYRFPVANFKLLDNEGNPMTLANPNWAGGGADQYDMTLQFRRNLPTGRAGGDASRLVWEIPIESKDMLVPFEFKDLPLP